MRQGWGDDVARAGVSLISVIGSALAIIWVLSALPARSPADSHADLILIWAAACVAYGVGVILTDRRRRPSPPARASRATFFVGLTALTLLGLLLRTWDLDRIPYVLSGDEASHGLHAVRVLTGELRNPFATAWLSVPTGTFFLNSVPIALLGPTVTALRLPWALVGTATIPIVGLLIARLTRHAHMGLTAAALLAVYHYHIHYSRLGANQIADPLFLALALLFLVRALDEDRRADWFGAGAVAGLALSFYTGARLTPIVLAVVLGWRVFRERRAWRRHAAGIAAAVGAYVVVAAPMLQYAWRFPDDFNGRINQVGIVQNGWLAAEMQRRQSGAAPILAEQLWQAAMAFNLYPDRTVWYGLPGPLLDPVFGAMFLLGLALAIIEALRPAGNRRLMAVVVWWCGGVVLGGMLTVDPPSSMRLVTLTAPVCFFIALAAHRIVGIMAAAASPRLRHGLLAAAVALFGAISVHTYFVDFTPRRLAGGRHAEMATEVSAMLRARPQITQVYVAGAPWMFASFPTWHYLAPEVKFEDVIEPLRSPAEVVAPAGASALFVVLPEREHEVAVLRAAFPHGVEEAVRSGADGRLLAIAYVVGRS